MKKNITNPLQNYNLTRVRSSLPFRNNFTISCDNRRIRYYLAKRLYATISRSMVRSVLSQLNIVSYYSKRHIENPLYTKRHYVTVSANKVYASFDSLRLHMTNLNFLIYNSNTPMGIFF
jgi:hypothetical protein